mmetsp:Transcript_20661/g.25557  ORF Transcript_20661/g.25557 Transcript_20661/m.25557 type:complete len:80 (-) Transcript_20661:409-648(-)
MKITTFTPLLVISALFGLCAGQVRGGVRPLVKAEGAVNPRLVQIEREQLLRMKEEMQKNANNQKTEQNKDETNHKYKTS